MKNKREITKELTPEQIKLEKEEEEEITKSFSNLFLRTPETYKSEPFLSRFEADQIDKTFRKFKNFYHDLAEKHLPEYINFLQNMPPQVIEEKNNIRVLIIIGAKLKMNEKGFLMNYQFYATAFLISHIFQNIYDIPREHILITTSNQKNLVQPFKVSPPTTPLKDNSENSIQTTDKSNSASSRTETKFFYSHTLDIDYDDIILSQVDNNEYRFYCSPDWYTQIVPFNREFLKRLNTDSNSKVYIFYLDHDQVGSVVDYQCFIERFLELNAKQYIFFNECRNSGSLIELIRISEILSSNISDQSKLSEIFLQFHLIAKEVKDKNQTQVNPQNSTEADKQKNDDEANKNEEIKELYQKIVDNTLYIYKQDQSETPTFQEENDNQYISQKIEEILSKYSLSKDFHLEQMINIIYKLSEFSFLYPINPIQFIEFKNKSTIFCSAPFNCSSMSLPIQFIHCRNGSVYPNISSHGCFFPSAFIQCLLNPQDEFVDPHKFANQIQIYFKQLESLFKDTLLSQIKVEKNDFEKLQCIYQDRKLFALIKRSIEDYEEIIRYFQTNYTSEETFITGNSLSLPDLKKLMTPKTNWCLNKYELPSSIYENLKYFDYDVSINTHEIKDTQNDPEEANKEELNDEENKQIDPSISKFGPQPDEDNRLMFEMNFYDCLEENLSKYGLSSKLNCGFLRPIPNRLNNETERIFTSFYRHNLLRYMDVYNSSGVRMLFNLMKHNLESNFSDTPEHQQTFLYCCESSIQTITKAWKNITI